MWQLFDYLVLLSSDWIIHFLVWSLYKPILLPFFSGCFAGGLQQGRQVSRTHNNSTSPTMDTPEFLVLGHSAAFTSHQLCLWRRCQRLPPPHHWLYHLPHHWYVNSTHVTVTLCDFMRGTKWSSEFAESSVLPKFLFLCSPPASIAIRRLIGVTEVKKTGSSYGDQESKKQN